MAAGMGAVQGCQQQGRDGAAGNEKGTSSWQQAEQVVFWRSAGQERDEEEEADLLQAVQMSLGKWPLGQCYR